MATFPTPFLLVLVALGGAAGAVSRAAIASLLDGGTYPLGTLTVNAAGSFLVGLFWGAAGGSFTPGAGWRGAAAPFLVTGFLGGFTTFSAFSMQTLDLLMRNRAGLALGNVLLQNGAGLLAAAAGFATGRAFSRIF